MELPQLEEGLSWPSTPTQEEMDAEPELQPGMVSKLTELETVRSSRLRGE